MLLPDTLAPDPRVEKQARTLHEAGYDVTILAWNRFGTSPESEERDGVHVRRATIASPRGSRWRTFLRIPRLYRWYYREARRIDYDVLLCHELYTWPVGWFLRLVSRRRTIFDAHEPYAEQIIGILPETAPLKPLLLLAERFLARRADHLITVTPVMVERYRRMHLSRITYLPNVPDERGTTPVRVNRVAEGRPFVLGRIGGISPRNSGVDALINIARRLHARGQPVRVVLGGPVMKGWQEHFRTLLQGTEAFVTYLGVVSFQELDQVMGQFDLMVNLREPVLQETFCGISTKIFDAMARGIPVLASRVGEDEALVARTGCGVLADYPFDLERLADRVESLIHDPAECRRLGANGLQAVRQEFNWRRHEPALVEAIAGEPLADAAPLIRMVRS